MKFVLIFLLSTSLLHADDLNVTISGSAQEKADLETLSPQPTLPTAAEMTFSLDGGKAAIGDEVVPFTAGQAALRSDLSDLQLPVLPTIPEAPFVVQPVPDERDPSMTHFKGPITDWEFWVIDENNQKIFQSTGIGTPPNPLTWNGSHESEFILKPDETYFPFIVLKSSAGLKARMPGEAERYLAFSIRNGDDEVITFGERLYHRERPTFTPEANPYLMDLARRLSQLGPHRSSWFISIYQPSEDEALGESRRKAWKTFLEKTLERKIANNQVVLYPSKDTKCITKVTLKNYSDPTRPKMTGLARDPRPSMEDVKKWIQVKTVKKDLVVEMRHDRLFRQGSAYLRDEALPLIVEAQAQVREINKGKEPSEKTTIRLRSYMVKPREVGRKRSFEEDPKLASLRTKVLFMLFAQTNYLP